MKRAVLILILLALPAALRAQELKASADRTSLMVGERLTVTLVLSGPSVEYQGPFNVPNLEPYLKLLRTEGPQTQQSFQFINGRMQSNGAITMFYQFETRNPGSVTIPAIQYRVNGAMVASAPIPIVIGDAPEPASLPGDSAWTPPQDPYVEVKVSQTDAYVGEQIVVAWFYYNREQFQDLKVYKLPTAGDFTIADLGMVSKLNPVNKLLANQRWLVSYLMTYAVFPNKAGELTLDSLGLNYYRTSNQRDFFGNLTMLRDTVDSQPVTIKVKPLPVQGKPSDFSGAVGSFKIQLDKTTAKLIAGEQLKFTITVTGDGHPDFVPKPNLDLPPGFEIYTESADKQIRNEKGHAVGERTFKMILVPRAAGEYDLGPFWFSAFDPQRKQYQRVESAPLHLSVDPNPDLAAPDTVLTPDTITATGNDLRFIKTGPVQAKSAARWLVRPAVLVSLQVIPIIALAAAFGVRRRRDRLVSDVAYARRLRAGKASRRLLKDAAKARAAGETGRVYALANQALAAFIADRMNRPEAGMTAADAAALLREKNFPVDKIARVEQIMSQCDLARFAPGAVKSGELETILEQIEQLIRDLDRENGK